MDLKKVIKGAYWHFLLKVFFSDVERAIWPSKRVFNRRKDSYRTWIIYEKAEKPVKCSLGEVQKYLWNGLFIK
jgi:hypothetical protein